MWAYGVFMFGAFCTLFSTLVVGLAAMGRKPSGLQQKKAQIFLYRAPSAIQGRYRCRCPHARV